MTPQDSTESQLERLQGRWEDDPSPHLSLQLADLYRQRGRAAEALAVLEKALADHPNHLSVRVALGRHRLEGEDAEGAAEALLAVVDRDPSHLVANKLLVRAYHALGDRQRAADRLDLYSVLSDGDPEIEVLRVAVDGMQPPATSTATPREPFALEAADPPVVDLTSVPPPSRRLLLGTLDRSPFEGLLSALPAPSPLTELFGALLEDEGEPAAAAESELSETASPADEISPEFIDALLEQEPDPQPEPRPEPQPESVEPVEEKAETPTADAEAEAEADAEARLAPREIGGGAGATATLGALYLAQDHLDEAQATFERVLKRDPEDAEARAGLAEVSHRREVDVQARVSKLAAGGVSGRKIELLESYLGRIREAAGRLTA